MPLPPARGGYRHPAGGQPTQRAVRSIRWFLTPRGFACLVWGLGIYLALVNSFGVQELALELADAGESLPQEVSLQTALHPRQLGRRVQAVPTAGKPFGNQKPSGVPGKKGKKKPKPKTKAKAPAPVPIPPPPPPIKLVASEPGPEELVCDALRHALTLTPAAKLYQHTLDPVPPLSVLLLTSGWGLPVKDSQRSLLQKESSKRGPAEWTQLVHAAEQNLQNPSVGALHIFLPPSDCAQILVAEAAEQEQATSKEGKRSKGKTKKKGKGSERGPQSPLAGPRLRLVLGSEAPSWAEVSHSLGTGREQERVVSRHAESENA